MSEYPRPEPAAWRPQNRFVASIASLRQLQVFNDRGGIAVNFDTMRSTAPDIAIIGSQSEVLSLWATRSPSGFVTKPKFDARLITVRFVTTGHIVYRRRSGDIEGLPSHATLVDFDDLLEVQASSAFGAVSGTFRVDTLAAAHTALTGECDSVLPELVPVAEVGTPGMRALFLTLQQARYRIQKVDRHDDLIFPLMQEVLSYQLLSAWPRRAMVAPSTMQDASSRSFRAALDYIEANLSKALTLAEIAAAAGTSVRWVQDRFRRDIGRTPVQFIIDRRLARVHEDLISPAMGALSIADIARRWGFVHMGDFARRYRLLYGRTPTEARRENVHVAKS